MGTRSVPSRESLIEFCFFGNERSMFFKTQVGFDDRIIKRLTQKSTAPAILVLASASDQKEKNKVENNIARG